MFLIRLYRRLLLDQWKQIDRDSAREFGTDSASSDRDTADADRDSAGKDKKPPVGRGRQHSGKKDKSGKKGKVGKKDKPGTKDRGGAAGPAAAPGSPGYDWRVIVVLIVVSISLSLQEYYGDRGYFYKMFTREAGDTYWTLKSYAWWSGWRFLGYVLIPMAVILCMPGERLRDYYISFKDFTRHLWIYGVLFLLILPAVIIAAQTDAFLHTYPFYRYANRSAFDLWAWEALYILQFFSLEFFFRGFMLRGLARTMGSKAIFVMTVPYCMIHFGKPFPETIGAIFAGIILGTVAMRTRSIWGGVLIHVGVALTMDLFALQHCPDWEETGKTCRPR
ncbi:MAG: CPBP family intramembrane glutamic endopeptidase [Myxococcota bacterium]